MPDANVELREEDGRTLVSLRGKLDAQGTAACWRELDQRLRGRRITHLEIDVSQAPITGAIGAALLRYVNSGAMTPGAQVELKGVRPEFQAALDSFTDEDLHALRPKPPGKISLPVETGVFARGLWRDLADQITFVGQLAKALPGVFWGPQRIRWHEVVLTFEKAGVNALPVVAVVSGLIGLVTVLEAAHPLAKFGAQIFLADMVGFASIRDTGPMVTAVMLAGRSSSAFAAELGTMKVNQELDALSTMGLDPVPFLVLPRLLAALILTPLLTLYAMVAGIFGGLIVMRMFGFPPMMIYQEILTRVGMTDVAVGLTKALLFGLIIGGVGCQRGLQTGVGPSAVGVSATRAVVASIILVIAANTLYSAVQFFVT